jgi:SAM-dependent methyltransferase
MERMVGSRPGDLPYPPPDLIEHAGPLRGADQVAQFDQIGALCMEGISSVLPADWTFRGKRVLDFGCGPGRVIRQFAPFGSETDFVGCDVHEASIRWAQANLSPPFSFFVNDHQPPLSCPDASFDLVYAMSVFTHLTDTWSAWLLELRRILRPGGYLVLSFLGPYAVKEIAREPYDESVIGRNEILIGNPWDEGGPTVLHSPWWLRAHLGRAFEVVDLMPGTHPAAGLAHGLVCLRKDDRTAPAAAELERPDLQDPRELRSMRHNSRQLRRDHRRLHLKAIFDYDRANRARWPRHIAGYVVNLRPRRVPNDLVSLRSHLDKLKAEILATRKRIASS